MDLARSRYGEECGVLFIVADACDLALEAARFDLVVVQNIFHQLPCWRQAEVAVLQRVRRLSIRYELILQKTRT